MKSLYIESFYDKWFSLDDDGNSFEWRIWQEHNEIHLGSFSLFISVVAHPEYWHSRPYWEKA